MAAEVDPQPSKKALSKNLMAMKVMYRNVPRGPSFSSSCSNVFFYIGYLVYEKESRSRLSAAAGRRETTCDRRISLGIGRKTG